jgi:hypothetical protein
MSFRDRFDRSKRKPSTRNQRLGIALFWLLVVAYAYVIPATPNFNTESHLYVAFSIVDHHTVSIDRYARRLGDESYVHGHYYSDKAPGLSLIAVPVYALCERLFHLRGEQYGAPGPNTYTLPRSTAYLRYAITYVLLIVPSALFAVLLWLFLLRFLSTGWAMLGVGVYALGTTAYPYSMWFFSHQIAAICLFSAFMLFFLHAREEPGRRRDLNLAAAGLLGSFAVISEYPTALLLVLLLAYLAVISRHRLRTFAAVAAGTVPCVAAELTYNSLAFGRPLTTGYMNVHSAMYRHHISAGFLGLGNPLQYGVQPPTWTSIWEITFGTYRGILTLCPVLILVVPGLVLMWRRRSMRAETILCAVAVVAYFLMDASRAQDVNGWSGGWSIASRHLVPMLPFMMLPVLLGLTEPLFRRIFCVLGGISVATMTLVVISGWSGGFPYADHFPMLHQVLPSLAHGKLALSWGSLLGLSGWLAVVPLVAAIAGLIARILWVYQHVPSQSAPDFGSSAAATA